MDVPRNCRYSRDHFWVRSEGNEAVMGISDYFQNDLGEIVLVDLPEADDDIKALGTFGGLRVFGVIESEEVVADLISPLTGTVVEVNGDLLEHPELANEDPYGEGWLIRVEMDDAGELDSLMTPEQYEEYIADTGDGEL